MKDKFQAIFLDRDGVINESVIRDGKPYPPQSLADFKIIKGVSESVQLLRKAGFKIIVVTNQPDVATGIQKQNIVEEMHRVLREQITVDAIYVCYHTEEMNCDCRKPKPGMLLRAAEQWSIDLSGSYMIGDRWRDVGAGKAAGCKTFYVRSGHSEAERDEPNWRVDSLVEATEMILSFPGKP